MKFTDALDATAPEPRRNKLAEAIDRLPADEQAAVLSALGDRTIAAERIRLALLALDPPVRVGRSTIERWRQDAAVR